MPAEDITVSGTFTANDYAVTYIVDGEVYKTDSVTYGTEIILIDEPTKEGHTFSGWSEIPSTMPAEDIVISGSFTVNSYTVIFAIDGKIYESMTVEFGAEIPTVETPVRVNREAAYLVVLWFYVSLSYAPAQKTAYAPVAGWLCTTRRQL